MSGSVPQNIAQARTLSSSNTEGWDPELVDGGFPLDEVTGRVKTAWPTLRVDIQPFFQWIHAILAQSSPTSAAIAELNVEDLFLAYACSKGDTDALRFFEQECAVELRVVAARLRIADIARDEIRQKLWHKLFTDCPGNRMRILDYRGTGLLRHWFRVLATRCILDDQRQAKRRRNCELHSNEAALSLRVTDSDPELAAVRRQYQVAFRAAFRTAVGRLEPEERNIIKSHYLMGMSTAQIGKAFGIHKATAARYLARTREKLLQDTRALIKNSLRANSEELNSAMRLFDEGLSISLSGLLQ